MLDVSEQLKIPFPVNRVHWRTGSTNKKAQERSTGDKYAKATKGMPLAYIDARDVMQRLDEVFGVGKWQDNYFETNSGRIICELSCFIDSMWIKKSDGAGDTGTEGEKGAISDAFKRAAVKFGIGRYLYAIKSGWIDLDNYGKFQIPQLPEWATPNGYKKILEKREQEK